jgi:hypothetical protein
VKVKMLLSFFVDKSFGIGDAFFGRRTFIPGIEDDIALMTGGLER